jgi:hypothetical protein
LEILNGQFVKREGFAIHQPLIRANLIWLAAFLCCAIREQQQVDKSANQFRLAFRLPLRGADQIPKPSFFKNFLLKFSRRLMIIRCFQHLVSRNDQKETGRTTERKKRESIESLYKYDVQFSNFRKKIIIQWCWNPYLEDHSTTF